MADYQSENVGITGADQLIANLRVLPGIEKAAALNGMERLAEEEFLPYVKEERVPFRLGILRSSGAVWREPDQVNIEFGTPGSGAEEYAVEQHERLDYHHEFGGAKYLEVPLTEWAQRFLEAAAQAIKTTLTIASGNWTELKVLTDFPAGAEASANQVVARATGPRLVKKVKP